ncbi:MAG: hypothetical protein ACK5LM_05380 [Lactovum sp.]
MKKISQFSRPLGWATVIYLFLVVLETLAELFLATGEDSSEIVTLFGVGIKSVFTPEELSTTFSLTLKALFVYLLYLSLIFLIFFLFNRKKLKE